MTDDEYKITNNQDGWMSFALKLETALRDVLSDIAEYERINNLAPNPGRKYCWDSVARAHAVLEQ